MNLDPQQREVVMTDAENVLCLAGAGAGKTRVLVERVAELIENRKVSPFEILCCSFTRKASQELRTRIEERIGSGARKIHMGTIHGIALSYLKRFGERVGLRASGITVYGEFEEDFLLKECAIDMGVYTGKAWKIPKRTIDKMFARYYEEGVEPTEMEPGNALFREFITRCMEDSALTYGGLLTGFNLLLPLIKPYLRLRHIFVDECQDLDRLQLKVFSLLREICGADIFFVGDISQSIYSWRGAIPEYWEEHSGEFKVFKIENNYRSLPDIVHASNRLIRNNKLRLGLEMVPVRSI